MEKGELGQKIDVLDFIIDILREHENNLDQLIQKLEDLICKLDRVYADVLVQKRNVKTMKESIDKRNRGI